MNSTVVSPQPTLSANVHRGDPRAVQAILEAEGVLRTGHFALLSGLHSDTFLAFSAVAAQGDGVSAVANWLSPSVAAWAPTLIVSPTTAGVTLASELARRLSVPLLLALVDDDGRPSSLDGLDASHRALIVNDVVTTGRSLAKLAELVRLAGAEVVGAAWFVSRAEVDVASGLGLKEAHVADVQLTVWDPASCPLCARGDELELGLDLN